MRVLEPGHIYSLPHLEGEGAEILTFIKRSGGAIDYGPTEHPGTNTQEVIRALIDRSKYLDNVLPCDETKDAIYFLRMALYSYEVRVYRRKMEHKNKKRLDHTDSNYSKYVA